MIASFNYGLAEMLALRPLDRVQLSDAAAIREMQFGPQVGRGVLDLPYLYFQRIMPNGYFELRSPTGYVVHAASSDVCDIVRAEPVTVRAMTRATFIERLKLTPGERGHRAADDDYRTAHVLYVSKDRWGRVDQAFVWFGEPGLDEQKLFAAPIHPDDRPLLEEKARRDRMPVCTPSGGGRSSAERGVKSLADVARRTTALFFEAALVGDDCIASELCFAGGKHLTTAQVNEMRRAISRRRSPVQYSLAKT